MAFYGYKKKYELCGVLVTFAFSYLLTSVMANTITDVSTVWVYILFIVTILLGMIAAKMAYGFYEEWALPAFAACLGGVVALELKGVAGLDATVGEVVAVVFAVIGFYVGYRWKDNKWLVFVSTACIGSFFITYGMSYYQDKMDSDSDILKGFKDYPNGQYPALFIMITFLGIGCQHVLYKRHPPLKIEGGHRENEYF